MRRTWIRLPVSASALLVATGAAAQLEPLPAPPPPAPAPPPAQYQPPPQSDPLPSPGYGRPQPTYDASGYDGASGYGQGQPQQGQPYSYAAAPPPVVAAAPEPETHAPKYALWTGARLSYLGFGFSFYENEQGQAETTGNFLGNGVAPQIDLGARIAYRYIPYLYWEHGFMGQGHRFSGSDARSSTDFYGIGFRYVSGDVDSVGFLTDLSIGKRVVSVTNGGQSYSMSGLEYFRLGLGAEIRLATLFTISPLFSISSGALNDSEGDVTFACGPTGCGDGLTNPTYTNGRVIRSARTYVVLSLGVGVHFDVFGK